MRELNRRIRTLESIAPPDPPCLCCGAPSTVRLGLTTTHRNPLKQCPSCKRDLDDHGRPLRADYFRVVMDGWPDD